MYTRIPSGRFPRGMRVPENYSGNAFRGIPPEQEMPPSKESEPPAPPPEVENVREEIGDNPPSEPSEPHVPVGHTSPPFGLHLPFKLFSHGDGIGFEELLLIGLILLISQEGKNDDLVLLLILLLFIQ